jgi:hypothetical protein
LNFGVREALTFNEVLAISVLLEWEAESAQ